MDAFVETASTATLAIMPVAVVFTLLALAVKRGRIREAWARARAESGTNMALYLVNYVILLPLFLIPVAAIEQAIPSHPAFSAFWETVGLPLSIFAAIVLIDLAAYWRHRLEHDPALWRIHATHHADEAMTWFSVNRKHPLARLLSMLADNLVVLALGFPIEAIVLANVIRSWWGFFIHADVPWTLGPLGAVLISPAAHRLHHIRDEALMGANYGNTLTLWDRVFGTYVDAKPYLNCETGIAEGTRSVWGELMRPWEARYRRQARSAPSGELAS
ncbi:sterol desaturase family protein [Qipengyuania sp. MTN3-11]|uniref:sterol desaturase family protein n=1 Tax=Qipengyuania sp. MTN3-11 TaxID=3056557 RepID=UPI0036F2BE48